MVQRKVTGLKILPFAKRFSKLSLFIPVDSPLYFNTSQIFAGKEYLKGLYLFHQFTGNREKSIVTIKFF